LTAAALRLESFAVRPCPAAPPPDLEVEHAYQEGYEQGLNDGRETSLDGLRAELASLGNGLRLSGDDAARIRREALDGLRPVLSGMIELLGRASSAQRLLTALEGELRQAASRDAGALLHIRAPTDMLEDIRDCVARAGLQNTALEDGGPSIASAEIRTGAGRTEFDPARTLAQIAAIIDDIFREE